MKINIQFKNTDYCEAAADFAKSKLEKLRRFESKAPQTINLSLYRRGHSYAATLHYHQGKLDLSSQALGDSFTTAIEQGLKRVVSQLSKRSQMAKSKKRTQRGSKVAMEPALKGFRKAG